jgi:Ca2+-binding RTX toxin-like protein
MPSTFPARLRGHARCALLGAVLAAVALPATSQAATIEVFDSASSAPHAFKYRAAAGERNDVRVTETANGSTIVSDSKPLRIVGDSTLDGCRLDAAGAAICAPNANPVGFELGDGDDVIRYMASEQVGADEGFGDSVIDGGAGNDTIFAGIRRNAVGVLDLDGGAGNADKLTYASAGSAATVTLQGHPVVDHGNDGVRGDANHIRGGFEIVEGTSFADTLTGSDADHRERFIGGLGNDTVSGLGGTDVFHEGSVGSGADTYNGGSGTDLVDYSQRTKRVDVRMDDLARNDGEAGERDFIDPNVNDVFGGAAGDLLAGGTGPNALIGNGGGDALHGNGGNDRVEGGRGVDLLTGGAADDVIDSADDVADTIRCEGGSDTLNRDLRDVDVDVPGCEVINP